MSRTSTVRRIDEIVLKVPLLKLEMDLCKKKFLKKLYFFWTRSDYVSKY